MVKEEGQDMTEGQDSSAKTAVKGLAEASSKAVKGSRGLPPVHLWNPPFSGDIDMRIAADGTWFYLGTPITRPRMVKLFASVLRRDQDDFFLVTPVEKVGITVDDAPFLAVEMTVSGSGESQILKFRTNVDDHVIADHDNAISATIAEDSNEPRPYVHIRRNLLALINRPVFYQLVDLGVEESVGGTPYFGVWSAHEFFPISPAAALTEG